MTTRIVLAAIALLTSPLLIGCGNDDDPARRSVTVVLDWTPNTNHAGVYLARARGAYARAGLDVDIIEPDQAGALAQVAAGNAQFAFSYAEQLLPARAAGAPVVSVATVLTTNTSSLVAPADRNIRRPRDLVGRTYGTFGSPIEEPLVRALVRCDGGDPDGVRFVEVGNADYAVGFRRNAYDVVWVFDGWDVIRLRDIDGGDYTTIAFRDYLDCIPDWYTPLLAATEATLRDDPTLVRDFLAATAEGYRTAAADPAAAADALITAVPETNAPLVRASSRFLARYFQGPQRPWGFQDPAVWRRFTRFVTDNDIIADVAADEAYTNDYLPGG